MRGSARIGAFALVVAVAAALATAPLAAETPKPSPVPALAKPASAIAPVAAPALKIEGLTKETFEKLPDDALLEVGGRKIRKTDFVADFKRRADARQVGTTVPSGLNAMKTRLSAEEDKAIADSAAQVRKSLELSQGGK